jgi:hypothetical protein
VVAKQAREADMLKARRWALARIWRPRGRIDEHGFHDQREAQRYRSQGEAAEHMWEQYGPSGSGF